MRTLRSGVSVVVNFTEYTTLYRDITPNLDLLRLQSQLPVLSDILFTDEAQFALYV